MRHLVFMRFNNTKKNRTQTAVHIQADADPRTWCNLPILSEETFEGRPISLVSETTRAATCQRCSNIMRTAIRDMMVKLDASDIEKIYNFIHG